MNLDDESRNAELTFPDLPRLELDQLLGQLVERAQEVMATQGRLRGLLRANQALLSDLDLDALLHRLTESARELVGARYAALGVLDGNGGLARFIHMGMPDDTVAAIGPPFHPEDLQMAAAFANQASVALELAESRLERERITIMDERDRIAADLHDHIIQRLFAAGLALQGATARLGGHPVAPRVSGVIDELDDTIAQIRTTIFAIQRAADPTPQGLRARLLELVTEATETLGFTPALRFGGPVDTVLADATDPAGLGDDLAAVLRESLSNVARHAHATRVDVELVVDTGQAGAALTLKVRDNGVGIGETTRSSGTANLRHRAERRGGTLSLGPDKPSGTYLEWRVPITLSDR